MKRIRKHMPSPALAVAFVALIAALTGTAAALPGRSSVDSGDIKNNTVRSKDIRNSTVRGRDVGRNTLTGADVNESKLGAVPQAGNAATLGGKAPGAFAAASLAKPFLVGFTGAGVKPIGSSGPISLFVSCQLDFDHDSDAMTPTVDRVDIRAVSTLSGTQGFGAADPSTPGVSVTVLSLETDAGEFLSSNDVDEASFVAPDGNYVGINGETTSLGLNVLGRRCMVAGTFSAFKGTL